MRPSLAVGLIILFPCGTLAQEPVDTAAVRLIRAEATERSRVMEYAFFLSEVYGPRFTGTPSFYEAGQWAIRMLQEMGLDSVYTESIDWGRGWLAARSSVDMVEPLSGSMISAGVPWSPGTNGPLVAEPVLVPLPGWETAAAYQRFFDAWRGRLRNGIILATETVPRDEPEYAELPSRRLSDEELKERIRRQEAAREEENEKESVDTEGESGANDSADLFSSAEFFDFQDRLHQFLRDEGVVAILYGSGHFGGTVHLNGQTMRLQPAWLRHPNRVLPPPSAIVASEHYNRIVRLYQRGIPVRLRVDLQTQFFEDARNAFNLIAELHGSDRRDEFVMIGAHLDSWGLATGATDNAAGSAVVMEAMRILTSLGLRTRRTVLMVLWGGHEGEGLGSRSHVKKHFDDGYPETWLEEDEMGRHHRPLPSYDKLSAYFNVDYLAGRIRGVFLQENEAVRPVFQAWLAPFAADGGDHISGIVGGGSDHMAFEDAGLPGFPFIQDGPHHSVMTHHSNMDLYDYLNEADLQQSAMILAAIVYHAAMREEMLPRKPRPAMN